MSLEADRFAGVTMLDRIISRLARTAWRTLQAEDMQGSFLRSVLPTTLAALESGQRQAAQIAGDYVAASLDEQGIPAGPQINAAAFAGTAADGRSLAGKITLPFVETLTQMTIGIPRPTAMRNGSTLLDSIVTTEVQDAARAAEFAAIAANAEVAGYVRQVEPGACSRCVILAGKFYRWNRGFDRHPRCRCSHIPRQTSTDPQDPRELFNAMSAARQDRTFGKAGAEAIRQGADLSQVVNVRSGMQTAVVAGRKIKVTSAGSSPGSYAGLVRAEIQSQRGTNKKGFLRLMPEEIIRLSNGDRAEARRLLITNGYIVGDIAALAREVAAQPIS